MASLIQSVAFNKNKWDKFNANLWLKKYGLKKLKPFRIEGNYIRARIKDPKLFKRYITKKLDDNINLIIGYR